MSEYWIKRRKKGYLRIEDIQEFEIEKKDEKFRINAMMKPGHRWKVMQVAGYYLTEDKALEVLDKIMSGDPKYVIRFGETRNPLLLEISDKLDVLADLIKYQPGGAVFQETLDKLSTKI